ncbi:MAG: polysaccharide deacetylase family protein [Clostridia bacterium]|nr:polysaccharide deacetylase family protein [Clostridia bacterium]
MKKFISLLLSLLIILSCSTAMADYRDYVKVPVIMYHAIGYSDDPYTITPESFEKHLQTIVNKGFTPVFFQELTEYVDNDQNLPDKPMVITFDDGYEDNYTHAFPLLKKYNCKATIFVIGSSVGKSTYKETENPIKPHFNYNMAREMNLSKFISVQSHTHDMHQSKQYENTNAVRENVMPFEGESFMDYIRAVREDFAESKSKLEGQIGAPVIALAYPSGRYNAFSEAVAKSLGIRVTVSTTIGTNYIRKYDKESLYRLNRYNMNEGVTPEILLEWLNRK